MSNLMLYVEENLLYLPERCYASDNTVADTKKNSYNAPTEELSDVPLISPQSVLDNLLLKPPPGIMLSDDAFSLLNTLKENKQNLELISECKASNVSNSDQCNSGTNPFLPNELSCNLGDHLTSESFMRLWNQNLLLQMQITATFNDLLTKVILQVPSKTEHNLCSEQQHDKVLNAFRNMNIQEHNGKGMSIASFNLDSLLSYNAEEKTTNLLHNINSKTDSAISTGSPANVTHPKNLSIHNSTMLYDNDDQHSVINNFKFRIPDKSSINTSIGNLNSTLEKSDVSSEEKNINSSLSSNPFRSVYKSFKMKSEPFLDEKNYVGERDHPNSVQPMIANDVIDNPECSNNLIKTNGNNVTEMQEETAKHKIIRKETNPFKLMLAGKIDIWKDADDYRSNSVNQKSKVTHLNIEDLHQESKGGSFRDIFQDTAICNTSMEKSQNNTTASSDRYIKIRSDLEKRESNKFPRNCDDNIDNVEYVFNKIYKTKPLLYGSQENEKKENIAEENSIDIEVKDLSLSLKENGNKIKQSSIIRWQDNRQVAESYCPEINSCSSLQPRFNNSNSCCNVQQVKGLSTMQENLAFTPHCTLPEMYATQKSKVLNGDCGAEEFASKPFDEQTPVIKNVYGTANDPTFIKKGQPLEFTDCCNNSYVDDEEYLTRPSTSHTRNSLSPPTCSIIGTNCRKQSFFDNRAKSDKLYSNAWYKPVENIDNVTSTNVKETNSLNIEPRLLLAGRKSPVFRVQNKPGNQVTTFCEQRVEPCDAIVKSMKGRAVHLETHHSSDSAATENQLGNIWKMSDWEKVMFSDLKSISWNLPKLNKSLFIFQAIELSSRYMYIFHYQGQGWLSIDEFVEVFTDFKTSLYMIKLLNKFCVDVTINVIHRGAYPLEFSHLDRLLWDVPRDAENKINQINLIPLQSVMNILYKLKIIVHNDIRCLSMELKNKRDRIVYDVSVLTNAYEKLTKLIEERQQYMVST
ncbi:hypothetical protein KM043_001682 [Ampulex compressa]|nr:hypothetical protein KM043_001682 [Ampulex compressa]